MSKRLLYSFASKHLVMKLLHLQLLGIQSNLTHSNVSEIKEESSSTNEIIEVNNHGLVRTEMIK